MSKIKTEATSAGRVVNSALINPDDIFVEKFGERWTNYRKRWAKASERGELEPFPMFVRLEAQFKCNSNCALCVHGHDQLKKEIAYDDYMPIETFKRLVDECVEHDCPSVGLSFINEPLMDPDFLERLDYVTQKGIMDVHLNSNAQLLTPELSEKILDSGVTRICFSIDANTKETFQKMRPNLDYDVVKNNIETFIKMRNERGQKLPLVRVSFLLNDINAHEADEFRETWVSVADYVSIQRFVPISMNLEDDLAHAIEKAPAGGKQNCSYPWESLFVHGDGVVVPCAAHRSRFIKVGNINEMTLYDIWHSKELNELREALKSGDLKNTKLCASCI